MIDFVYNDSRNNYTQINNKTRYYNKYEKCEKCYKYDKCNNATI